ncbi:MAG TPA: radical SAM protein [Pyrinomonadaceae bacterium]|nr:radical SAM protein [Pyrinomonadaceae bacterium]
MSSTDTPRSIAFVHAPDARLAETQQYGALFMPVWAYTLAAYVEEFQDCELRLHDTRFDRLADVPAADLFVFSGVNQDYESIVEAHDLLRARFPSACFVVGGPLTWSFKQAGEVSKLGMFDHVFVGDGEEAFPRFVRDFARRAALPKVIETLERFDVTRARGLYRPFLEATRGRYYGAVLEVSRGCPFLCEFCDVRVLPDNNRAHNFRPEHVVSELDYLARLGVRQVLLAADNFIGDVRWAEEVCDRLAEWQERTGLRVALYTWLTVNLSRHPRLLSKMRRAGFDLLFVGVESFSGHSLLETAKVQNAAGDMIEALREIQSYGFVVVAGLIFGFDSDTPEVFDLTLGGMAEAGLISGDPSLLTALPGTPLFRRMKLSGRLRDTRYGLGGYKYRTNLRYLMAREELVGGYRRFVARFCEGRYQYGRLRAYLDNLDRGNYQPLRSEGYGSVAGYARAVVRSPRALLLLARRLLLLASRPRAAWHALRGLRLVLSRSRRHPRLFGIFQFWLFAWTNAMLKYGGLRDSDFDVESVPADFDRRRIVPEGYAAGADEPIPRAKIEAQQRATLAQLRRLADPAPGAPHG